MTITQSRLAALINEHFGVEITTTDATLHRDAINRRLRPVKVAQPNYAALGFGSADEAEGRN